VEGQSLDAFGWVHRRGKLHCTAILPDGSKTFIPADWTDLGLGSESARSAKLSQPTIGVPCDLLKLRSVVDALMHRASCLDQPNSILIEEEKEPNAIEVGASRNRTGRAAPATVERTRTKRAKGSSSSNGKGDASSTRSKRKTGRSTRGGR
jgi:hypothetical protein